MAVGFAAVAAGAVGTAVGWWAGREISAWQRPGGRVLRARATERGQVDRVGGRRDTPGAGSGVGPSGSGTARELLPTVTV